MEACSVTSEWHAWQRTTGSNFWLLGSDTRIRSQLWYAVTAAALGTLPAILRTFSLKLGVGRRGNG